MIKTIPITIDDSAGTAGLLKSLKTFKTKSWKCNTLAAMLRIGYLTSPPTYTGFHLSTFWAWLRYSSAIDLSSTTLQLRKEWTDIDPHQKTILSDDFGMGFTCQYLADQHGFDEFVDTKYLIDVLLKPTPSYKKIAKNGHAKAPDFIVLDGNGDLHVLECKGSQSSKKSLKNAMHKGINQKNNLKGGTFKSSMVGGIYVPLFGAKEKAEIVFIDPEPNQALIDLSINEMELLSSTIYRMSLSKILVMAGLWKTATSIYNLSVSNADREFINNYDGELNFVGYKREGDFFLKEIDYRSFESFEGSNDNNLRAVRTSLHIKIQVEKITFLMNLFADSLSVSKDSLDGWINSSLETSRKIIEVKREDSNTEKVASTWSETLSDKSSTLHTPYGISFTLSREHY